MNRRGFLLQSTAAAALPGLAVATFPLAAATAEPASGARPGNPIAVSTYSFWHIDDDELVKIEDYRDGRRNGF